MAQSGFEVFWVACAAIAGSAVALSSDEALDGYMAGWHVGNPSDIKAYQGASYAFHFHGVTAPAGVDTDGFVDFFTGFRKTVAAAGGPAEDSTDFMRTYGAVRQNVSGYTLETGAFVVPGFGSGTYHAYARDGVVELEEAVAFAAGIECLSSVPAESLPVSGAPQQGPVVDVGSDTTAGEAAMERLQRYLSAWGLGDASAIHTEVTPSYRFFFAGFTPADGVNASGFEAFFGGMRQSIAAVGGPTVDSTDFMQLQGEMRRTLTGVDGGSFSINSGAFVVRGFGTGVYHAIGDNMGVLAENAVALGAGLECMHAPATAVALSNDEALDGYMAGWHVGNPSDIKAYQGANYAFHFHGVTAPAGVDTDGFVDFFTGFRKTVAAAGGPAEDSTDFMRTYGAVRQNVSGYTLETGAFVVPGFGSGTYHAYARDGVVEMEEAVAFAAGVECLSSVPAESLPVSGAPQQGPVVDVGSDSTAGEAAMERLQRYLSAWGLGDASAIHTEVTPSYRVFFAGFTPADGVNASGFEAFFGGMRQSIAAVGGPTVDSTDFMQLQGEMSRTLTGVDGGSFSINSGAFVVRGFGTGVYHAIGDNMGVLAENAVALGAGLECMHTPSPDVNDVTAPDVDNAVPKSVSWWRVLMVVGLTSLALFVQS